MSIKAGLVGLPNVGKSTLFNALTKSSIPAENYPFCTIDPHIAITTVPDVRVSVLQKLFNSQKKIPATVTFVDIAGLVKGAASGEGLGNKFLSHIREINLIIHVLRCFKDENIIHSQAEIDPVEDYEIILSELMLKDLESIEKRLEKLTMLKKSHQTDPVTTKKYESETELLNKLLHAINNNNPEQVKDLVNQNTTETIPLLTAKKFVIVANIDEQELENKAYVQNQHYQSLLKRFGPEIVVPISAKLEYELSQLNSDEAESIMGLLGIEKHGVSRLIQTTYRHLDLITFFTCGPKEIHAWPIQKGITIREAAGNIHSDLERGFICAEIIAYLDLIKYKDKNILKDKGLIKTEGQHYLVQDADIVNIRFNV